MKVCIVALMCVGLVAGVVEAKKNCYQDPCKNAICRHHPEAECRIDYCRGDAAWYYEEKEVDCDECPYNNAQTCEDECATTECPNYPDAQRTKLCRMYNCGQCTAEFFTPGSSNPLDCWAA